MQTGTKPGKSRRVISLTAGDRVFRLHKDRIVIGTLASADVRLMGEGISPIHAVVELGSDATATIYDLASDAGIVVNGKKAVTQSLKAGDNILIGRHTLRFGIEDVEQLLAKATAKKHFLNPGEDMSVLLLEDERMVEEIFDFSPSTQLALQVTMSWRGTVLNTSHFVKEKAVTVGNSRGNDFGIPPILSSGTYQMVTRAGDSFILNLDTQMKGVMQRKGGLHTLDDIRATSMHAPMEQGDFAKVTVGEIDFYISYTPAPPRLRTRRLFDRDPLFLKIVSSSMVMTAVAVAGLLNMRVTPTLEAEQLPERIATILYQPEKYNIPTAPLPKPEAVKVSENKTPDAQKTPEPEKTTKIELTPNPSNANKPIPKEMQMGKNQAKAPKIVKTNGGRAQGQAKEGEGARAKGKEGSRGAKNAKPGKEKQTTAMRPSPQGGSGRGAGNSQVQDEGNVDLLKGMSDKVMNLLGNSAANLGKGGDKLKGFGAFTTQGDGGLALSGSGKGGGGDAASLGGLGKNGRGGGRVGTGLGAAGNGQGIVGGAARVVIRSGGPEEAVVIGSIDADAIEAALLAHRDEFRLCYEKEINAELPDLAGRVGTSFVIGSSGRVTDAGVESTTLKNANAERCILNVIKRIQFPIPRGAGVVQVAYPFKFSPVRGR